MTLDFEVHVFSFYLSYLFGAHVGDTVIVDVKVGKSLAYLECELRHKNSGKIIAKGTQTRYIASESEPNVLNIPSKSPNTNEKLNLIFSLKTL